ncbi:MAG: hypothetical protein Q9163_006458 [Psora crenata]
MEDQRFDEEVRKLLQRAEGRMREVDTCTAIGRRKSDLKVSSSDRPYITSIEGVARADSAHLLRSRDREAVSRVGRLGGSLGLKERKIEDRKATVGERWLNLPRTNLTPELERDLRVLRMRGVLDPKRHYKKDNTKSLAPEFSQVGEIIEGTTEFFSARIPKKDRKRTLLEEVLAGETSTGRFKGKYNKVQAIKTSGKKAFYKKVKEHRRRHNPALVATHP